MISSARYPLKRSAPAFHVSTMPLGIEHENRVVADALDQEPEALLALPQFFLLNGGIRDHGLKYPNTRRACACFNPA